jgi:DNA-directed RNA polymerase specialized sigma24 family protein
MRFFRTKEVLWPKRRIGDSGIDGVTFGKLLEAVIRFAEACAFKRVPKDEAREVGQNTVIKFWKECKDDSQFLAKLRSVAAYVRTMVAFELWHRHANELKSEPDRLLFEAVYETRQRDKMVRFMDPEVILLSKENVRLVVKTLEEMPETRRNAFMRVCFDGLSYAEAAAVLATTEEALRALVHLAGEDLRRAVHDLNAVSDSKKAKKVKAKGAQRILGSET